MLSQDREAYRQAFLRAWQKYLKKQPLEPYEKQIAEVILLHPHYHVFLESDETSIKQDFSLTENPFIHMSLHLALKDQMKMNQPLGIQAIYQSLLLKWVHPHEVEHCMMRLLVELLWEMQQSGVPAREEVYLAKLRALI